MIGGVLEEPTDSEEGEGGHDPPQIEGYNVYNNAGVANYSLNVMMIGVMMPRRD